MAHLAHISTWKQLPASYLLVCGLQLTTTPPGPLRFFDISYLAPLWTWIWRPWITYCLQPQTPWLHSPLFLLQLIPLSFVSTDSLISIVSKEQISSSFPNFFFSFPADSSSFPASFPLTSHRIAFSEVGECLWNIEVWSTIFPEWIQMIFLLQRLHLNRYLNSFHISTSELLVPVQ